jgi:hypothetical protein
MIFDKPPTQKETIDQQEVWSAIRYLDADVNGRNQKDKSSDMAAIITVIALVLLFLVVWGLLWLRTM